MKVQLLLQGIEAVSVNSAFYLRNKRYNQKARDYRSKFLKELNSDKNKQDLLSIRKKFNAKKHCLKISLDFYLPKEKLLTKDNKISRSSKDVDNLIKLALDFLTHKKYENDTKYAEDVGLDSLINLKIDDQYVGEISASKRLSLDSTYYLIITIELLALHPFINYSPNI